MNACAVDHVTAVNHAADSVLPSRFFVRSVQIALLPLDVLKIKAQTNPESLAGRGVVDIFTKEGRGLYRGAGWTAARNAPGSFALFGGASVVKEYVFRLERPGDATLFQAFCASIAGAISRCGRRLGMRGLYVCA